jgi:hypothetical protein
MLPAMVWSAPRAQPARVATHIAVVRPCDAVGQPVAISGRGFVASSPYDLSIDGVDFGQSLTDAGGDFSTTVVPGGLGAGQFQIQDRLTATDGGRRASATFTVTRRTGALFGAGRGSSPHRSVPFDVWDFAPSGTPVNVYLHYVTPAGTAARTVLLGSTSGQCGALVTRPRQLFPFTPSAGTWTLQFDTSRIFSATPRGKQARLRVAIS